MTVTVCPVLSRPWCILPTKEPPIVSQRNYDRLFDWVIMKYNSCYLSCRKLFSNDTTISRSSTNRTNNVNFLDARPTHVGSQYVIINSVCKKQFITIFLLVFWFMSWGIFTASNTTFRPCSVFSFVSCNQRILISSISFIYKLKFPPCYNLQLNRLSLSA